MKQLYKIMALFLLLALAGGQLGFAQDVNTETIPPVSESTICESALPFTWNDVIFTAAGDSTITLVSSAGADSMVTMRLYVTKTDTVHLFDTLCAGETFDSLGFNIVANIDIDTATTFSSAITACDSVTILHLTVHQPSYSTYSHDACDSFTWIDGVTYTESNDTATYTLTNAAGCDSVVTLNLTINPTYFFETDTAICAGDSLRWQENYYKTAGVYWDSLTTAAGCDSIYKLHLTVNPLPVVTIIATADTVCGGEVVLMANGNTNYSYQWSNGSSNSWISVDSTGSYSVTATDPNECSNTVSKAITVNQPCHTMIDTTICQGESFDFFGESKTSTGVYVNTATATNDCDSIVTLVLAVNPAYYITRTVTICEGESHLFNGELLTQGGTYYDSLETVNGCDSIIELKLTVNPLPKINVVADPDSIVCEGGSITLIAEVEKTGTYLWNTGETERKITGINSTGTYTVTFTETATGCKNTASKKVIVNPVTYGDTTAVECESFTWYGIEYSSTPEIAPTHTFQNHNHCDSIVTLHLTINDSHDTTLRATICEGDSYNFFGQSIDYSVGTDTLTHTLYTSKGCDSVITLILTVNPLPDVTITTDSAVVCAGAQTTLVATDGMQYHYQWSTSPGDTNVSVSVGVGNYTVTVTDDKSCSNTASFQVTERAQFSSGSIVSGDTAVCFGSAVSVLIGNSTSAAGGDGLISYRWKCNNVEISNSNSSTISVDVSTLSVGTFSYTREAKDNTCNTGWTASGGQYKITVHQKQTLSLISGDSTQTICYGNSISPVYYRFGGGALSASVSGLPAGVSATLAHDTLYLSGTPSQIGTSSYTVNTVSGNVCEMATRSGTITVLGLPNVTISGDSVFCQGNSITLTASPNSATSYAWSNGQSGNAITVNTSGNYTVTVTDGNHCSASASKTVTVNPLPNVTIAGESSFCQGEYVTLTASGANSYAWSNGNQNASITVNTVNAGSFPYTVTGTVNGCSDTATKTVTVNPTYATTVAVAICQGKSYDFFGQPLTAAGSYTHKLYTSKGCDSIITLTLTVHPLPNVTISGNDRFCFGENVTLTASDAAAYLWSNGDTTKTSIVNAAGTYRLTCTNQYGCTASADTVVTVDTLPVITIIGENQFCHGSNTVLKASGAGNYVWSTEEPSDSITVSSGGIYSVTGTDSHGCSASAALSVTENPLPNITIAGNSAFCQGDSITLTASGADSYSWSTGSVLSSTTIDEGGAYTVIGTNAYSCTATTSKTVSMNPLPTVSISGASSFCEGYSTSLTASAPTSCTYAWSQGANTATITVNNPAIYTVTATNANGCANTATQEVTETPTVAELVEATACEEYDWNGSVYNISGDYTKTLTAINGCDSIATLHLTINYGTHNVLSEIACESYTWHGTAYYTSGTYTFAYNNNFGCPSVDTLHLTVNYGTHNVETKNDCESYTWHGITYYTSGIYTYAYTNTLGCESMDTLHLTVHHPIHNADSVTECDHYTWTGGTGQTYTTSGTYTYAHQDTHGCTQVDTLLLVITPNPTPFIFGDSSICYGDVATLTATGGETYLWSTEDVGNSIVVAMEGLYTVTATNMFRCSSTAEFTVSIAASPLAKKDIVGKSHVDGSYYMLIYPEADLQYQWYKNSVLIVGATKQYYYPSDYTLEGSLELNACYQVEVRPNDQDLCGIMTDCWEKPESMTEKIRILPNPNNGRFRLLLPEGTVDVQILNANGQLVLSRKTDGATELEMDTGLANGLYFVKTFRQDGSFNTEKLIINR